ncbi:hypothetical protein A2U01_0021589, partial [Trifolium medium]|nr:hypothetical protein [Trifolium medium]
QAQLDFEAKKLQSLVKEKTFLISETVPSGENFLKAFRSAI